jgi:hypothetical protein
VVGIVRAVGHHNLVVAGDIRPVEEDIDLAEGHHTVAAEGDIAVAHKVVEENLQLSARAPNY